MSKSLNHRGSWARFEQSIIQRVGKTDSPKAFLCLTVICNYTPSLMFAFFLIVYFKLNIALQPNQLTHYHTMPHFDTLKIYSCKKKTLREKEKLLVTSNFSFSHDVFYPLWHLFFILNALQNVVCNLLQFGPV